MEEPFSKRFKIRYRHPSRGTAFGKPTHEYCFFEIEIEIEIGCFQFGPEQKRKTLTADFDFDQVQ
jgi:hypothetical protein